MFEGEITKSLLMKCLNEIDQIIDEDEDSIYIYEVANPKNIKKQVFGQEKTLMNFFFNICSEPLI